MKFNLLFIVVLISQFLFGQEINDSIVNDYFDEIARHNEFNSEKNKITKFVKPINVYIKETYKVNKNHITEIKKVFTDLKRLCPNLIVNYVKTEEESNFIIIFGDFDYLYELFPNSFRFGPNFNAGGCVMSEPLPNSDISSIVKVGVVFRFNYGNSTYIDDNYYHLIREEITQCMGLFNDSWKYPNSIFYQGESKTTRYSKLDEEIIKKLYRY